MMYACAALCVLVVSSVGADKARDPRAVASKRFQVLPTQVNCYDVPTVPILETQRFEGTHFGRRTPRHVVQRRIKDEEVTPYETSAYTKGSRRRQDRLLLSDQQQDLLREHAKLVQDINGLSQVIFYAPQLNEPTDYEESIYHDIVETHATTTAQPPTTTTFRISTTQGNPTGIPVILAGGVSKNRPVRNNNQLIKTKQTINLVGSSSSPKISTKAPYPFVLKSTIMPLYSFVAKATTTPPPMKICMPILPPKRLTLWQRLVSFFPRLV